MTAETKENMTSGGEAFTTRPTPGGPQKGPRPLGVVVKSVNWPRLFHSVDGKGKECVLATMGQGADSAFVLKVDLESGECVQHSLALENANFPTAAHVARDGRLYIGASYSGHLFRFDPKTDVMEDLGQINGESATFICGIAEDDGGRLWIGSYPDCDLTSFDPEAGEFIRHGRMHEEDMYLYPFFTKDGLLVNLVKMTKPHLVLFDRDSGNKRVIGPVIAKEEGGLNAFQVDGELYVETPEGSFRLEGESLMAIDELPDSLVPGKLSDGRRYFFEDKDQMLFQKLRIEDDSGKGMTISLNYEAKGNNIFCIETGPDGKIYGSSILPFHFFEHDPETGHSIDHGVCSLSTGEGYSMAVLEDELYISGYPGAHLSVYDPKAPYRFGEEQDCNPRALGRMDEVSYRPRSTLAGPLGKVWTTSIPDYGMWSGPLSCYDPSTGERKMFRELAGEGSCYTLAECAKLEALVIGTNIAGGSGTQPKLKSCDLILWQYVEEREFWRGAPAGLEVHMINGLVSVSDHQVAGTLHSDKGGHYFLFDALSKEFRVCEALEHVPLDNGIRHERSGCLVIFTPNALYRWNLLENQLDTLHEGEDEFQIPGPVINGELFYGRFTELKKFSLQ